jgi:hypothetical protein
LREFSLANRSYGTAYIRYGRSDCLCVSVQAHKTPTATLTITNQSSKRRLAGLPRLPRERELGIPCEAWLHWCKCSRRVRAQTHLCSEKKRLPCHMSTYTGTDRCVALRQLLVAGEPVCPHLVVAMCACGPCSFGRCLFDDGAKARRPRSPKSGRESRVRCRRREVSLACKAKPKPQNRSG